MDLSKNMIYCVCDYLNSEDLISLCNTSKKINKYVQQYIYTNLTYIFDGKNVNCHYYKKVKLHEEFNGDMSYVKNTLNNLANLHLGYYFNQDIRYFQNTLNNLTSLHLGFCFNQDISYFQNTLNKLTNLHLGWNFNQDISYLKNDKLIIHR